MTDQELLEAAAKAAGMKLARMPFTHRRGDGALLSDMSYWNPLADDGDALRLAFDLGMQVHCDDVGSIEAVRLDIVRAAEIGKSMEKSQ